LYEDFQFTAGSVKATKVGGKEVGLVPLLEGHEGLEGHDDDGRHDPGARDDPLGVLHVRLRRRPEHHHTDLTYPLGNKKTGAVLQSRAMRSAYSFKYLIKIQFKMIIC